ncbi:unnamed protein product [Soboliphyme baturini]|uniref:Uncharacterized protein n=1 Tax=Soboliphyme baturini TaxID=241478 RepID=A0A183INT4_9BILA|nr:unnamed protein product [Soboliphyme baturini]
MSEVIGWRTWQKHNMCTLATHGSKRIPQGETDCAEHCFEERDRILLGKRRINRDIAAVPSFNTGSNHRLVRVRLSFDEKIETKALQLANRRHRPMVFDEAALIAFISSDDCGMKGSCDYVYEKFAQKLRRCIKSAEAATSQRARGRISEGAERLPEKLRG